MRQTVLALAILGAAAGTGAAQEAAAPAVTVAAATMSAVEDRIILNGRLLAERRVEIRARVTGILEEVAFTAGDVVEAGQILYRIEDDVYRAAVQEAEGAVRSAQAARDLAELERDRQAELVARDASPQALLDQAQAALGRAEGELTRLEGSLARARIDLGHTEIPAPFAGRVGISSVDPGALVSPDRGGLVSLIALDPIHAEASVPTRIYRDFVEALAAGEATGAGAARLILANGREYPEPGRIEFVDSEVTAGTDSVRLRIAFPNGAGVLLNDELVRVVLESPGTAPRLTIPQNAVQRDLQGAFALVVDAAGTVTRRPIEVARIAGGTAVVASGLEEGDRVITEGVQKVRPGITVDAALAGEG
jgi:membrane fusion protein (multidrug efflux system)